MSNVTVLKRVKHKTSNGRPSIQYSIQLVDKLSIDDAIAFMISHYVPRENLNKAVGSILCKEYISEAKLMYWKFLSEGISLAAFLENENGEKGEIISCDVLCIDRKDEERPKIGKYSKPRLTILKASGALLAASESIYTKYNCSSFLGCRGLAVAPEYEGLGIGTEMLRAHEELCKLTNVPVSATTFTGQASQRMAARLGYELLSELDLTTFRIDGQILIPSPDWPVIRWMAIRYL